MDNLGQELFNKAQDILTNGGDLKEAEKIFNLLLNTNLDHEDSHFLIFNLASVYRKKGNDGLSTILYHEVLKRNPDFIEAINNIGYIHKNQGRLKEAADAFKKIFDVAKRKGIKFAPKEEADFLTNLGSIYIQNGTPLKAIGIFDKALALDDTNESALWNRSLAYLESGDYARGFDALEFGKKKERGANKQYTENKDEETPFWDGTPGKNIIVYGEQGIGDEIMFASMLPDVMKDCTIILDAHTRLADLFRLNFPTIPVYGTRETPKVPWAKYHNIDAKIEIGTLGKFYRRRLEDFPGTPYLKADPRFVEKYKKKLEAIGGKPKVGVSWRGGVVTTGKQHRYVPLDLWKEIFAIENVDFISLQYDRGIYEKEVKSFEEQNGICLNHWQDAMDNYDETAGLVSNLDLIISVPQSVVHLAGSLGTPTWQLSPKKAMWQVGVYGQDAPWYGCVENIWQDSDCQWQPVMKKVKGKLCSLLQKSIAN